MTPCDHIRCPDPAETWCLVSGRPKRLCEGHRTEACRRFEVVVAWEAPIDGPAPSFTNPTTDAPAAPATTPTEEETMPTACRWPGCTHPALAYRFCARELKRMKSLGFTPAEVTDDQIPALVEAWETRQAARVLPTATHVGETPPGSWETPAPFTAGSFAPEDAVLPEASAEAPADRGTASTPITVGTLVPMDTAEDPYPFIARAFGDLLGGAARLAGVTIEDGAETAPSVQAVLAGLREMSDRANQRDELQAEVGRLTRDLAERTRDLEVVHGILQDAVPPAHMHWPTTAIARTLIDQCATFRTDLQAICMVLDVTVPAAVLPVLREWSADRMRGEDAEKLLNAIDDALRGAGIDTEVHPHLDGIEKLRSQRDAAQAQLDAGGPAPAAGLVLSDREVAAIGLALDAVLAGSYDSDKRGAAQVIRALVGLPTGKAS